MSLFTIFANLVIPISGLADIYFVGQMKNQNPTAGIALGTMIFDFLFWGFGFLRMGTTSQLAILSGEGKKSELGERLKDSLHLAFGIGLALILLTIPIWSLVKIFLSADPNVLIETQNYFRIRILSAPFTLGSYVLSGYLLAVRRGAPIVLFSVSQNGLNIFFNWLLVNQFNLSTVGVATATAISNLSAFLLIYLLIQRGLETNLLRIRLKGFRNAAFKKTLIQNSHLMVRTLLLISSFSVFTNISSSFSKIDLIANTLLLKLLAFIQYFMDGFANSLESFGGRSFGEGNFPKLKMYFQKTVGLILLVAIISISVLMLFGDQLIFRLNSNQEVCQVALKFLPYLYLVVITGGLAYSYDGLFIGIGKMKTLRNAMIVSSLVYFGLSTFAFFNRQRELLWLSLAALMLMRFLTLFYSSKHIFKQNA